ncbi:hypothetical protein PHMEG_0008814 [Phytophthora megakarya]|uniref:Uncharacterized protein n=1 Tax=Phytophthora megakarya TaxID=4795 RepID=A0A225WI27_9STRA|nr:hypothetical protein PHMEG_0008814 [Phytophthora megakarya]
MAPPPPPPNAMSGPPPPMPPQLQAMMRQMQKRQPKFQQQTQSPAPYQQQRGRGRERRGRGRGTSDAVPDASRFFMPSFLIDPWKELKSNGVQEVEREREDKRREEMRPRQVQQYATKDGPGRVFFQPSFLEDPWAQLVR